MGVGGGHARMDGAMTMDPCELSRGCVRPAGHQGYCRDSGGGVEPSREDREDLVRQRAAAVEEIERMDTALAAAEARVVELTAENLELEGRVGELDADLLDAVIARDHAHRLLGEMRGLLMKETATARSPAVHDALDRIDRALAAAGEGARR